MKLSAAQQLIRGDSTILIDRRVHPASKVAQKELKTFGHPTAATRSTAMFSTLPTDVLAQIVSLVPRTSHPSIALTCCALHNAVCAQPTSVLTHVDQLHAASLDFAPPAVSRLHYEQLCRAVSLSAQQTKTLRLHSSVPRELRLALIEMTTHAGARLERLALPDVSTISKHTFAELLSLSTLRQLEVSNCNEHFLRNLPKIPSSCEHISLVKTHHGLLSTLCKVLLDWKRPKNTRADLTVGVLGGLRMPHVNEAFSVLGGFLTASGRDIRALFALKLIAPYAKDSGGLICFRQAVAKNDAFLPTQMKLRVESSMFSSMLFRASPDGRTMSEAEEVWEVSPDLQEQQHCNTTRRIIVSSRVAFPIFIDIFFTYTRERLRERQFPALRELCVIACGKPRGSPELQPYESDAKLLRLACDILLIAPQVSTLFLSCSFLSEEMEALLRELLTTGRNLRDVFFRSHQSLTMETFPESNREEDVSVVALTSMMKTAVEHCDSMRLIFLEQTSFGLLDEASVGRLGHAREIISDASVQRPELQLGSVYMQVEEWMKEKASVVPS